MIDTRYRYRAVWSPKYSGGYKVQRRPWFSPFWLHVRYARDIKEAKTLADEDAAPQPPKQIVPFGRLP